MKPPPPLLPTALKRGLSLGLAFLLTFTSVVLFQTSGPAIEPRSPEVATEAAPLPDQVVEVQPATPSESATPAAQSPTSAPEPTPTASPSPASPDASPSPAPSEKPANQSSDGSTPEAGKPQEDKPEAGKPEEGKTPNGSKPDKPNKVDAAEPAKTPEEIARWQKLAEADKLYREGNTAAAQKLYQQAKAPFTTAAAEKSQAFTDPEQLSPGGKVYWREAQAGFEQKLETRIFVPLKLLVEKYPEFVLGHIKLAQAWEEKEKPEEAIAVLERACSLYPDQPDLLRAKIAVLAKMKQWIEASIAARQFALLYPDNPTAAEFTTLADENLKRYQSRLRSKLTGNLIGNIITGALGYAFTGNLFGPLSAIQTTALLLRGESAVGERYAKQAQRQLEMVDDPEMLGYVDEIGQKLAKVAGRNDFQYKFYVVNEKDLNAFALPGGKVFVNSGAIIKANSEAELAGLLGHELSHAVLSHGFQLVTESNLTANVFQFIPFGGLLTNLIVLDYSRDMERQADILGTRLSSGGGYAADGLRNLMMTLKKEDKRATVDFLSSHPVTDERVKYLEQLISQNGYNRYAYEGVERHAQMQEKAKKLLQEKKERDDKKRNRRRDRPSDEDEKPTPEEKPAPEEKKVP